MPKVAKMKKNCRIQVEWLEPGFQKGQLSTVQAKKIPSFEKGLHIGQTVLCFQGLQKYKAIVRATEEKENESKCREYSPASTVMGENTSSSSSSTNSPEIVVIASHGETPDLGYASQTTKVTQTTLSDALPQKSNTTSTTPSFPMNSISVSAATQTDGPRPIHERVYAIQWQLQKLAESNAFLETKLEAISDLIRKANLTQPLEPPTPFTPQQTLPLHKEQPVYGNLVGQNVKIPVENGSIPFIQISKVVYDKIFYTAKTATSFAQKLMPIVYSKKEIQTSNSDGGEVLTAQGYVVKPMLERARMSALLSQVELEFPGSTMDKTNMGKLRDAINVCCRMTARKNLPL